MAQKFTSLEVDQAIKIFEILAQDDYSPLWWVIGDFTVNGHKVSIGDSNMWHHIIIDDGYVSLKFTNCTTYLDGFKKTYTPMEYIAFLLNRPAKEAV